MPKFSRSNLFGERRSNKRIVHRGRGGRFRKAQPSDIGITGVCEKCHHFLTRHYDGDERERPIDPRKFRDRCLTCEPYTETEITLQKEIADAKPKRKNIIEFLREAAEPDPKTKGD